MGWISLGISLFLFLGFIGLCINLYLVNRSDLIAGTEGVGVGAGVLEGTARDVSDMFTFRY